MVVPADPTAPFVVIQSKFFLQLLIVLLDLPATLRQAHQAPKGIIFWQVAEEVFNGFFLRLRPFHQQPYLFMRWFATDVPMRWLYPHGHEARLQPSLRALPPANDLPPFCLPSRLQHRDGTLLAVVVARGRGTSTRVPGWNRRGRRPGPDSQGRGNPHDIPKSASFQPGAKLGRVPIPRIGHHNPVG